MKLQDVKINDRRYDRRCKLSDEQREEIMKRKGVKGYTIRGIAREFGISARTIQFMWYPERREKNRKDNKKTDPVKDVHYSMKQKQAIARHNAYKRRLATKRLIDLPVSAMYHDKEYVWPFKDVIGKQPTFLEKKDGTVVKIVNIKEKRKKK